MSATRRAIGAVLLAALLVTAGCASSVGPSGSTPTADVSDGSDGTVGGDGGTAAGTGTVEFYVSDEQNAIDDFEHLNVTITKVGLHRVDGDDDAADTPEPNGTAEPTETVEPNGTDEPDDATPTPSPEPEETPGTDDGDDDAGDEDGEDEEEREEDEDDEENDGDDEEDDADDEDSENGEEEREGDGEDEEDDGEGDGEWVEYEVNATVDLTELRGANATKLDELPAPNGTYDKVFVYVSEIDATLESGESVNVKLPSSKLQINKKFTVGDGQRVKFVYDLSVHKAGKSGKYILKPVISQSGTSEEVEIEDVDERDDRGEEREEDERDGEGDETDEEDEEDEREDPENESDAESEVEDLRIEFRGPVRAGESVTVAVRGADGPVEGATVDVNGETVGETGADGTITVDVPADAEELEVEVRKGDAEAEATREVSGGGG